MLFHQSHLHVRRLKNGINSVHPIQGDELRALRELRREQQPTLTSSPGIKTDRNLETTQLY
jgi:hypothetical protein